MRRARLSQRMDAIEDAIGTVEKEVLDTVPDSSPESSSTVAAEVISTVPLEKGVTAGEAQRETPSSAPPFQPAGLTQMALAKRLGCSDKAIEKQYLQGNKENFAAWSRALDPNSIAWTWEGLGGRGQPLRFVPAG